MKTINYHILTDTIVINFDGKVVQVNRNDDLGAKVLAKIKTGNLDDIPTMIDIAEKLKEMSHELFVIDEGALYSYGELVPAYISKRVFEFMEEELPFEYLINFWNNLKDNPSNNSKRQLFEFLEANHFALTPDGHFIAYKKVKSNFMDDYTGEIDNSVGEIVEMERDGVVDDPNQSCSAGLHIAPYSYAKTYKFGGKLIELKVNPRDVVSVPHNYAHQKARVCKYLVVGVGDEKDGGIKDTVVSGEKFEAPVDVVKPDINDSVGFIDPDAEAATLSKEQIMTIESNVGFIDPVAEGATLEPAEIEEVEIEVKDEPTAVIKIVKLGNFKYQVVPMTFTDYTRIVSVLKPRKKSRWAKAFVDTWKKDIVKIERCFNDICDNYEYVITLKNGSIFYSTIKLK